MGYKLNSLVNLPFDESVRLYIFCIGETLWKGGLPEIVHKNFDQIARDIGSDAIIVGALQDEFHGEVVEAYLGKNHKELKNEMPALLITDEHPDSLSDESLRILIPLGGVHEPYPIIDNFLNDLVAFIRGKSDLLLQRLEKGVTPRQTSDVVRINIPLVPGFVAVNLNNAVKKLREWWNTKKR